MALQKSNFSSDLSWEGWSIERYTLAKRYVDDVKSVFHYISKIDFRLRVQICLDKPLLEGLKDIKKFTPSQKMFFNLLEQSP